MSGYYALLGQRQPLAPSLLAIAQASGWTMQQRDARAQAEADRKSSFEEQTYIHDAASRQMMANQAHQRSTDALALKRQQAIEKSAAETSSANKQRYFAQLLQSNPQDADRILAAAKANGVDTGQPITLNLPGGERYQAEPSPSPQETAMGLEAQATGVLGAQKPTPGEHPTNLYDRLAQEGLSPGTAEWQARAHELNNPRSVAPAPPKALPQKAATGLADLESGKQILATLLKSYNQNVPSGGMLDQLGSRAMENVPNSQVQAYRHQAEDAARIVGSMLGIKIDPEQLPKAGDAHEVAIHKVESINDMFDAKARSRVKQYGAAGYQMSSTAPVTGQSPTDAQIDAELKAIGGG